MTEHRHSTYVEGCYRCSLSRDEEVGMTNVTEREYEAFLRGFALGEERLLEDQQEEAIRSTVEALEGSQWIQTDNGWVPTPDNGKHPGML